MVTRVFDFIEKMLSIIIIILLAIMATSTFYQIVLRFVFKGGNVWSEELTRYCFVWVVMLGSVVAIRKARHMRIDFFINLMGPKLRKVADVFAYVIMTIFLIVLTMKGMDIASQTTNQLSSGLKIPMSFMYSSIPISSVLMLAFIVEDMTKIIRNKK